jgi:fatty acid desaturase
MGWWWGALGHDAGHFAASRIPWINDWGVGAMSLLCNPILWQHQHTYAHHSFTNELAHDPDIHHFTTFLRVHGWFPRQDRYHYQSHWWYVVWAYSFVTIGTCLWIPQYMMQTGSLYDMVEYTDRKRWVRSTAMIMHWVAYIAFIVVLPFWTHGGWWRALLAVWLHMSTSGLIFAFFSQINHINEASFTNDKTDTTQRPAVLQNSWAVQQIEASNNFCPLSSLWYFLSNGLNLQIEHHLFPSLNHCHLHILVPVVQATCDEFGIRYKSYDSWWEIVQATRAGLNKLAYEE